MAHTLRISNSDTDWCPKYFGPICGLFCALYMITTAANTKIIDVYGFILPAGIITFPLCCIIADLMTEIYGFNRTRQAIWTVLVCLVLYAVTLQIGILLPEAAFWQNQDAYATIFDTSWRFALAGCMAWLTGEFTNSFIMAKMKLLQKGERMSVRFIGSTVVGQLVDTTVFMSIAFAGTMTFSALVKMTLITWAAKVLYEVVALPISVSVTKHIKRLEGVEHFDNQKISIL